MHKFQEILVSMPPDLQQKFLKSLPTGGTNARLTQAVLENPAETRPEGHMNLAKLRQPLTPGTLRKTFSNLKSELYDFIIMEKSRHHSLQGQAILFEQMLEFGSQANFESAWKAFRKAEISPCRGEDSLEQFYRIWRARLAWLLHHQDRYKSDSGEINEALDQISRLREELLLLRELRWACLQGEASFVISSLGKSLEERVKQSENPFLKAYYYIFCIEDPGRRDEALEALPEIIDAENFPVHEPEAQEIFNSLLNFWIDEYTFRGIEPAAPELNRVYRIGLEREFLLDGEGEIDFRHYLNIPTVAQACGQLDFAREFIRSYRHSINGPFWKDAYIYQQSKLLFWEGNFAKALANLDAWDYRKEGFNLRGRILKLKTLFELRDLDRYEKELEALARYLQRREQNLPPGRFRIELERINNFRQLIQLMPGHESSHRKFMEKLDHPTCLDRQWFREKGNEVLQKVFAI